MAFQYPQFLYALFLLIIPILIHLFQLRKFKKIEFSNVALLKKISIQSRKSSKLKKYLVLATRMLTFTVLIIAFAQPYLPSKEAKNLPTEYVIYLDNSFSMGYKVSSKSIFEQAKQELLKYISEEDEVIVFTNHTTIKNSSNLKNEILDIQLSPKSLKLDQVLLKSNSLFSDKENTNKKLILLSDFQANQPENLNYNDYLSSPVDVNFVKLKTDNQINTNLKEINYKEKQNQIELEVELEAFGDMDKSIDVSIYDQNELIARKEVDFKEDLNKTISFKLSNKAYPKSRIEINADGLDYDNVLYFSINENSKIEILSINQKSDDFLKRIYSGSDFNYSSVDLNELSYSSINQSDVIILNEVEDYSTNFNNALKKYLEDGGQLIIIPAEKNVEALNQFLKTIQISTLGKINNEDIQLTKINFQHPIYINTFVDEISSFDYPNFRRSYTLQTTSSPALSFSNQIPFLVNKDNISLFAAPLNKQNSNFQNSPLIVPTFYNLAKLNRLESQLYFELNENNVIKINWESSSDHVIQLLDDEGNKFIPQQQKFVKQVEMNTAEVPEKAGNYAVVVKNDTLKHLSFNYPRNQSLLNYYSFQEEDNVYNSIEGFFNEMRKKQETKTFWYWFLIFALIFLVAEFVLLNYFKK